MIQNPAKKLSLNFRSLDALRGILAVYVLWGHCRWLLWAGNSEWKQYSHPLWSNIIAYSSAIFRYGHEAVMVFFVLSGFFIHLKVSKQLAQNKTFNFNLIDFYKRRCHRLILPYILALFLTIILDRIGLYLSLIITQVASYSQRSPLTPLKKGGTIFSPLSPPLLRGGGGLGGIKTTNLVTSNLG